MTGTTAPLSDREQEILKLVATGATNQQIANALNISINTVKVHLRNIFGKISATSRTEATLYAVRLGLVQLEQSAIPVPLESVAVLPETDLEELPILPQDVPETAIETAVEEDQAVVQPATVVETVVDEAEPAVQADDPDPGSQQMVELAQPAEVVQVPEVRDYQPNQEIIRTSPDTVIESVNPSIVRPRIHVMPKRPSKLLLGMSVVIVVLLGVVGWLLVQRQTTVPSQPTAQPTPTTNWRPRAALTPARTNFALTSFENRLYVIGGATGGTVSAASSRYDPTTDVWATLSDKPTAVSQMQAITIGGRIYVPGGELSSGQATTAFEVYDPRSERWETLAPLPAPRSRYGLAKFEGRLFLFGGWDGAHPRAEVLIYDPATNQWTEGTPMPTARQQAAATTFEDRIYVIGGEGEQGALQVNERFDPTVGKGSWESKVPLPVVAAAPVANTIITSLVVFEPQRHVAWQYNVQTDVWTPVNLDPTIPLSNRATTLNTTVFVFGQMTGGQAVPLSEYQPVYTSFLPSISVNR